MGSECPRVMVYVSAMGLGWSCGYTFEGEFPSPFHARALVLSPSSVSWSHTNLCICSPIKIKNVHYQQFVEFNLADHKSKDRGCAFPILFLSDT